MNKKANIKEFQVRLESLVKSVDTLLGNSEQDVVEIANALYDLRSAEARFKRVSGAIILNKETV